MQQTRRPDSIIPIELNFNQEHIQRKLNRSIESEYFNWLHIFFYIRSHFCTFCWNEFLFDLVCSLIFQTKRCLITQVFSIRNDRTRSTEAITICRACCTHKVDNIETLRYRISVFFYYPNLFAFKWMHRVFSPSVSISVTFQYHKWNTNWTHTHTHMTSICCVISPNGLQFTVAFSVLCFFCF